MNPDNYWLAAEKALIGSTWQSSVYLHIVDGCIEAIRQQPPAEGHVQPASEGVLVPGFVDVQVNGGGGVLLNDSPDLEGIRQIFAAHAQFGTTAMLPTLITDSVEVMQQTAEAIAAAIAGNEPGIVGVHFEGPHMSLAKRGVHSPEHLRALSDAEMAVFARQDLGVKVITVAPEVVSPEQIRQLVGLGVRVCLGHSDASAQQVQAALAAGASGFTHLYNGMSALTSREPGMVGTALADERSWCGLILDGHHVHPLSAKLAIRTKGIEKIMLVTDAMPPVGTTQSDFAFYGERVVRHGTKLTAPSGSLAGSVLDMAGAVRYAVQTLLLPLSEAVQMASASPAAFLGLSAQIGSLEIGKRADMLLLDDDLNVKGYWLAGRPFN
ncbi:N-acetylglucosamine-6-phosphate deacetylase [Bowmanella sp. Y26]|uniref:N-acetylglucosamine-6-phosphate deacetylase n=1 Tax=Bowmanella yangjiangensis TaxID=2811230 RepID=UPI001BDDC499|nr:N-acetylglucosamine-6-phosphate deacetylase [Bowmanella yangjiangensis]MBT1063627.1 N-acetylglucosamine-6-phosphate deacetylase [Bowmanella yangjiangensis]